MNDAGDSHKRGTKHDSSRCRKRGVITERMRPSFTVCLSPRFASSWLLNRRGFQCWCVLWFPGFLFRLVRRKILLVHVDDLYFSSKLAIAPEKNFIARLFGPTLITISQLYHGARGQQVRLFVNRHPIVIDRGAGGSYRKARFDFGADIFQPQHTVIHAIDPDAAAITRNRFLFCRSAFAPAE